ALILECSLDEPAALFIRDQLLKQFLPFLGLGVLDLVLHLLPLLLLFLGGLEPTHAAALSAGSAFPGGGAARTAAWATLVHGALGSARTGSWATLVHGAPGSAWTGSWATLVHGAPGSAWTSAAR